ncbi:MAG: LCP family protein [Kibdelosporangium sp.]
MNEEVLIRQAIEAEADQAVDAGTVLAGLSSARPKPRRTGLIAVAGLVVIAGVIAVVVPLTASRQETHPASAVTPPPPLATTDQDILLVGTDGRGHTDTIILVRLGANGSVRGVSLPRDTMFPGLGAERLNMVYAQSGAAGLTSAVEQVTGVRAEHYAVVDMAVFGTLSDAVGGVPVCLNKAARDQFAGIDLPAGQQVLTGPQALAFVRQRHGLANGDLDRIVRQQAFLRGLAAKLTSAPQGLGALATAVRDHVQTDDDFDFLAMAGRLTTASDVDFATIPAEFDPIGGLAARPDQVSRFTTSFLTGTPAPGAPAAGPVAGEAVCVN